MTYTDQMKSKGKATIEYVNHVLFTIGLLILVLGIAAKVFTLVCIGGLGMVAVIKYKRKPEPFDGILEGQVREVSTQLTVVVIIMNVNSGAMPVAASTLAGSAASYAAAIAGGLTVARAITHKVLEWKFTKQLEGFV